MRRFGRVVVICGALALVPLPSAAVTAEFVAKLLAFDGVFWLGEEGGTVRKGFEVSGGRAGFVAGLDIDEFVNTVMDDLRGGDAVLVKGSRACNLDRVVSRFCERSADGPEN